MTGRHRRNARGFRGKTFHRPVKPFYFETVESSALPRVAWRYIDRSLFAPAFQYGHITAHGKWTKLEFDRSSFYELSFCYAQGNRDTLSQLLNNSAAPVTIEMTLSFLPIGELQFFFLDSQSRPSFARYIRYPRTERRIVSAYARTACTRAPGE